MDTINRSTGVTKDVEFEQDKTTVLFTILDTPGGLNEVLTMFGTHNFDLTHIQSRLSRDDVDSFEFEIDFKGDEMDPQVAGFLDVLREHTESLRVIGKKQVPWFPRHISDFDHFTQKTLDADEDLEADHPGFNDAAYRQRRQDICTAAMAYKAGTGRVPRPIEPVQYHEDETAAWGAVYTRLMKLYPAYACREANYNMRLLQAHAGYSADRIPQLEEVSVFLREASGFSCRPITGLLSARAFLAALAFRVFFSTQYIRHPSQPFYTPEPDVCHELLGHVPMFADPDFADFSQEIGLASLGASDADIERLATCYWFSVEFGLCREKDAYGQRSLKAYGAGCLSSFGELEHCMSDKPEVRPWDPLQACKQEYPITTFQPVYYAAESFADARERMSDFASTISRPFNVRYNTHSQRIEFDRNVFVAPPSD